MSLPTQVSNRACKFFNTLPGCKHGNKCRFLHLPVNRVDSPIPLTCRCHLQKPYPRLKQWMSEERDDRDYALSKYLYGDL